MKLKYSIFALIALNASLLADEVVTLEQMSVTATKIEKATKEISESIAVVDEKTIEDKNILNIQDALQNIPGVIAESSSNSPSPRLIIRGAGLKARFGVREIMVMKDGVPMTDPDSFTRFDFIDMQDVSSIEVQKGPGSINAVNSTGGVIQLITKSVFDEDKNSIKVGAGNDNQRNVNLKLRGAIDENDFASFTLSSRKINNSWRDNNEFDTTQVTLKYGHIFDDEATIENELSYTESNLNLPASMTKNEFEEFKKSGKQHDTSNQWQHSARDSKIISLNSKYEKEVGDITYKPRFYFNSWEHFHPVTGLINDADDNKVFGTDLEFNLAHKLFSKDAMLVGGLTLKMDKTNDAKKYQYRDIQTQTVTSGWPPSSVTQIVKTLSNEKGALSSTEDSQTLLYGAYLMESFKVTDKLGFDISTRVDKLKFDIDGNEITKYDYASKSYKAGIGEYAIDSSFTLLSGKLGSTYAITDNTNIYASIAGANQAPTTSELGENEDLKKSQSINYEVGLKTRTDKYSSDLALFQNFVDDEIIQIKDANGNSIYDNAGKTDKKGLEYNIAYDLTSSIQVGGAYAYSDFKFDTFNEQVRGSLVSRDGNYLPYIPKNQYSLFAAYNLANGFKTRVTTRTYGSYYMDNANTQKYEGYDLITDFMIGYEKNNHNIQLNINNLFDKYYASEASKDVFGVESYKAATPRMTMLTYTYKF
ncbi:TonB-dependent receptor [Arcobacter cloacae]|uniref:TonB-dependent receptor n=1 Tax=Arcobacter cloacae TaxID=1054034 RepID=A0A6M8N6V2_9BACT|nr:TonB-dependent receptor [Arcobacter cloacae]QKF89793.1 TonB-dependent receptor [Arcobacter cloacae]RXI40784.1 TonB-dependent receptor [Arcobacter cloacae]